MDISRMTRREALRKAAIAGAGAAALGASAQELVAEALAAAPKRAHSSLADIEHVIILIQENRSFDSYFGTFPGVRGYGDSRGRSTFFQKGNDGAVVQPFHFSAGCMDDITHDWAPQHQAWNNGRMDKFLIAHQDDTANAAGADETMGYFDRSDIPLYYALAEKFTICDGYHCSVIGPTDPNRLMSISAWLDPHGTHGGPLVETASPAHRPNNFSWTTMPEMLSRKGISVEELHRSGQRHIGQRVRLLQAVPVRRAERSRPEADLSRRFPQRPGRQQAAAGVVADPRDL